MEDIFEDVNAFYQILKTAHIPLQKVDPMNELVRSVLWSYAIKMPVANVITLGFYSHSAPQGFRPQFESSEHFCFYSLPHERQWLETPRAVIAIMLSTQLSLELDIFEIPRVARQAARDDRYGSRIYPREPQVETRGDDVRL